MIFEWLSPILCHNKPKGMIVSGKGLTINVSKRLNVIKSPFSVTWSMFLFLFKTLYKCNPSSLVEVKQRYCNTSQANKHNVRVFTTHDMQRRMKFIQHYAAANHKWDYRSISLKSHLWYQSQHFSVCLICGICVVSMGNYVTLAHQLL